MSTLHADFCCKLAEADERFKVGNENSICEQEKGGILKELMAIVLKKNDLKKNETLMLKLNQQHNLCRLRTILDIWVPCNI